MFVLGISLVKNEEDIIESFIRCNLKYLDGIVVFDNQSTDGTRDILKALMQEGLPICLSDDYEYAYKQSEKMTNLFRRVASVFPVDFVVPLDADEFIECQSRFEFQSIIKSIPMNGVGLWKWKTYLLDPKLVQSQEKAITPDKFRFHRNEELPQFSKVVIRVLKQNIGEMELALGNHQILFPQPLQTVNLDIPLAHFPLRSKSQVYKRAILGYFAYLIEEKKEKTANRERGFQKRNLYSQILQGKEFSDMELSNFSLNYAQIPGGLQWPGNVKESKDDLCKADILYDKSIHGSNTLIDVVKSYQKYVSGPALLFDPLDTYKIDGVNSRDIYPTENDTAFKQDWSLNNIFLDIPPFKYLYDRFSPNSVFDVGCGIGKYARLFSNLGVRRAMGTDNIKTDTLFIDPKNYVLHDLSKPIDLREKFDLVICCEVAEHLYPGTEDTLIANINRHAEHLILFSAAAPGQPGLGHINCKPLSFWASKWSEQNWSPMLLETFNFRSLSTFSWLRRNPVLLKRVNNTVDAMKGWAPLIQISEEDYTYYSIPLDIITNPLAHEIPLKDVEANMLGHERYAGAMLEKGEESNCSDLVMMTKQNFDRDQPGENLSLQVAEMERYIQLLNGKLHEIEISKAWRMAMVLRQIRILFLPPRGWQSRLFRKVNFALKSILSFRHTYKTRRDLGSIRDSSLFDRDWYLAKNPDVGEAKIDPARHYLFYGGFEDRDPSQHFSSNWYLETYDDVKKAKVNPLLHYLRYGKKEGRLSKKELIEKKVTTGKTKLIDSCLTEPFSLVATEAANDQLLYFTSSSLTTDDQMLFFISDRTGNPNLFGRDLQSGGEWQISSNSEGHLKSYVYFDGNDERGFGKASVSLHSPSGTVYFLQGRQVMQSTRGGEIKCLTEIPSGQVSAFTHVSQDGRFLCVPTTDRRALDGEFANHFPLYNIDQRVQDEGLNSYLRVYDTVSGELVLCEQVSSAWVTHVQFCPTNSQCILYNHEWPGDCGIRRVWLWDGSHHIRVRTEGDGRSRFDWVSHEIWESNGKAIVYHGGYADGGCFIGRVSLDDGLPQEPVEIGLDPAFTQYGHFTLHPNDQMFVSDGLFRMSRVGKLAPAQSNLTIQNPDLLETEEEKDQERGVWISLQIPDWHNRIVTWVPICRHGSTWESQDSHPHPIFIHSGDAVLFTSDKEGRRVIYKVNLPDYLFKEVGFVNDKKEEEGDKDGKDGLNIVFTKDLFPQFKIGRWTYGRPEVFSWDEGVTLEIGSFSSIAAGVKIFLGGEHRVDWVTTYPVNILLKKEYNIAGDLKQSRIKGNVKIGNDVWIGADSVILSGVKVGDGAVIGTRSVVTQNVPPYAIVFGNPAKVLRYRFNQETINALLEIAWWTWEKEKIVEFYSHLLNSDIREFISLAKKIKNTGNI